MAIAGGGTNYTFLRQFIALILAFGGVNKFLVYPTNRAARLHETCWREKSELHSRLKFSPEDNFVIKYTIFYTPEPSVWKS